MISKSERHYLAPLDFHTSDKAFRCRLPGSLESTPKKQISYTSEDVWIGVRRKTGFSFKKMLTLVSLVQLYFTIYFRCAFETLLEYNWKRNSLQVLLPFLTLPGAHFETNLPSDAADFDGCFSLLLVSACQSHPGANAKWQSVLIKAGETHLVCHSFLAALNLPLSWSGSQP